MFTIVISEKGGAERRETFERNEISVGRVQGNDLMLPKGNVSKHHARLLFRDSRFIVTDLKSTNGTYVNGRKISQATIVREGDKIYLGDFVLRVEAEAPPASTDEPARAAPRSPVPAGDEAAAMPAPALSPAVPPAATLRLQSPPPALRAADPVAVSHFPLERDPDSESAPELVGSVIPRVPGPPRLPQAAEGRPGAMKSAALPDAAEDVERPMSASEKLAAVRALPRATPRPRASRPHLREAAVTSAAEARRLALITLVDRIADVVDLSALDRAPDLTDDLLQAIDRAAREQAAAMRSEGEAPDGLDVGRLAGDAVRELAGLGPIGPLLEDDEVSEIHVAQPDRVWASRGTQVALADPCFTSDQAVARALVRLAHHAGEPVAPGETVVERRLAWGTSLVAVRPPWSANHVLTIRKRRSVASSFEELVRAGGMSTSMSSFLTVCVEGRANVIVVGQGPSAVASVLAALASAAPLGERIAVLQSEDELFVRNARSVAIEVSDAPPQHAERLVHAAARLGAERIVIASLAGAVAGAALDVVADRGNGIMAGLACHSLRQGLARLVAQVALNRPGASIDAIREAIAQSFDIAIEAAWAPEGKLRVLRIAELAGADATGIAVRDIFTAKADRAGEPSFAATGIIPLVAVYLAAKGIRLDSELFTIR